MAFKGDPNKGVLAFLNGSCGCVTLLGALISIPLGILLITGIFNDPPAWLTVPPSPSGSLPDWSYLAFGLICLVGLAAAYGIYLRKWWGVVIAFVGTGALIVLQIYLGYGQRESLALLVWPILVTLFLWAPWRPGIEGTPDIRGAPTNLERQSAGSVAGQKPGTIKVIKASDIPEYVPPPGTAQALAQIEQMKNEGDIIGLLHAKTHGIGWEASEAASVALSELDGPGIVPDLVAALQDPDAEVREEAANRLGKIKDARVARPLIAALADPDSKVRGGAAYHIGKFGDQRAIPPLIGLLDDGDHYVRMSAAKSLGDLGDPQAVEPLIPLLQDPDEFVVLATAGALGELGDKQAVKPLRQALSRVYKTSSPKSSIYQALKKLSS